LENKDWKHGALTLAFREALRRERLFHAKRQTPLPGQADNRGGVTLLEIRDYVVARVAEITDKRQSVVSNQTGGISLDDIVLFARPESATEDSTTPPN
jgi:hypothetical protein